MKPRTHQFFRRSLGRDARAVVLALVGAVCAAPQAAPATLSCGVSSTPVLVRAEGIAELSADIVVSCTAASLEAGEEYQRATLSLDLNVNATNNRGFGHGIDVTDAVLVVNENNSTNGSAFSTLGGPNPRFPLPHYGRLASARRLVWGQVNVPIPGASNFPTTTTLRITNLRVNASQLDVTDPGVFPPPAVTAAVSLTGAGFLPVSNASVNVALPAPGLNASIGAGPNPATFLVRLREGFQNAFKLLGDPSFTPGVPSREAGYPVFSSGVDGGGATQATRVRLGFDNVPPGLEIRVPDQLSNGQPVLFDRVMNAGQNCTGGFLISGPGMQLVPISSGSGSACYELMRMEDPEELEETEITIVAAGGSFTGVTVSVSLAPTSVLPASESGQPVPRFVDRGLLSRAGLRIVNGNEQSAPEGTTLPIPLTVQVTGSDGFGIPGVEVTFSLREGNLQADIGVVLTDAVGWASRVITLPRLPRVIEIVASAPGFDPVTFLLTAEPVGAPGIAGPRVKGVIGAGMSVPSVEQTSQNAIISVFGENFTEAATGVPVSPGDIEGGLLPFKLAKTCVQVGRTVGRLFFVSPGQIDVQVPRQNINRDGLVQVIKNCGDADEIRSTIRDIPLRSASPEFFFFTHSLDGKNPIAAISSTTGKLIGVPGLLPNGDFARAKAGDVATVFMTGLGLTNPVVETGQLADRAAEAEADVRAFVNGQEVAVIYAGVTPGNAGLYQVSFMLPGGIAAGNASIRVVADDFETPPGGFLTVE